MGGSLASNSLSLSFTVFVLSHKLTFKLKAWGAKKSYTRLNEKMLKKSSFQGKTNNLLCVISQFAATNWGLSLGRERPPKWKEEREGGGGEEG